MNLWEAEEHENKGFFDWRKVNCLLLKKILLVFFGDVWLMSFFLGIWEIMGSWELE